MKKPWFDPNKPEMFVLKTYVFFGFVGVFFIWMFLEWILYMESQ